ncbi:MAG: site-2 protease family protein, partial [Candidatus Aenigmarchaeota archaeon]|nr:site-2 protease family protein [Candidatus Aenigmarchaeota archaeon]
MFDLYTVSMLVFVGLLALFFWADRKNVERQSFLLLRKTTKGKAFLTWLGQRFPRLWWVYGSLAIGAGFLTSVFISLFLVSMISISLTTDAGAPIALVLPSPTTEVVVAPGVLGVPFWFWIISIFVLILVHEGSHGLMAAREKVRIKTLGWGLMIAIPLAFVEPDEEQLKKEKPMKQLRVFAAGSFGNFVLAGIAFVIVIFSIPALFAPAGVSYSALMEGYPAEEANLTGTITGIDGHDIVTIKDLAEVL